MLNLSKRKTVLHDNTTNNTSFFINTGYMKRKGKKQKPLGKKGPYKLRQRPKSEQ